MQSRAMARSETQKQKMQNSSNTNEIAGLREHARDSYFDFLRGVAIIMVIGIHTYCDDSTHTCLIARQFLNCAVPIFLAVSGFFMGRKSFLERGSYVKFLSRQIPRVYIPMLIWSLPWVLLMVRSGASPVRTSLLALAGGMSIFYFVTLIIQYYVMTPAIKYVNNRYNGGGMQ